MALSVEVSRRPIQIASTSDSNVFRLDDTSVDRLEHGITSRSNLGEGIVGWAAETALRFTSTVRI